MFLIVFHSFFPFLCPRGNCSYRSSLSRKRVTVSDLLLSLFTKELCEWFALDLSKSLSKNEWFAQQNSYSLYFFHCFSPFMRVALVPLYKRATLSESLLSFFTKEGPWAIRSRRSFKKSESFFFGKQMALAHHRSPNMQSYLDCAEWDGPHLALSRTEQSHVDSAEWGLDLPRTRCSGQSHSLMLYLSGQPPPRPQASASTVYNQLKYK